MNKYARKLLRIPRFWPKSLLSHDLIPVLSFELLQLYLWERQPEVLARHVLLLRVALDCELPLRQRANVFLEIFGNTLVQV